MKIKVKRTNSLDFGANPSMRIVARIDGVSPLGREFREGGSGKHHRGEAQSSTQPCHATGNVSNFLWLLCIPMNGEGLEEKRKGREGEGDRLARGGNWWG